MIRTANAGSRLKVWTGNVTSKTKTVNWKRERNEFGKRRIQLQPGCLPAGCFTDGSETPQRSYGTVTGDCRQDKQGFVRPMQVIKSGQKVTISEKRSRGNENGDQRQEDAWILALDIHFRSPSFGTLCAIAKTSFCQCSTREDPEIWNRVMTPGIQRAPGGHVNR